MKILVIAPDHHDLPNASVEIAAIDRYHDARILRGVVRDGDIAEAVDDQSFDIIWWITHGGPFGVLLTGETLGASAVGQYVRKSRASLCVLNTCESEDIALRIIAGGRADMICTIAQVSNKDAIRLGQLLAGELASNETYYAAYEIVAPAGGMYRYIRSGTQYRRRDEDMLSEFRDIDRRALADRTRIQLMIIVLTLVIVLGGAGLYREATAIQQNQVRIMTDIRELEGRLLQLQLQHNDYSERVR